MAIGTLAYTKALEASGLDRKTAEAHAEALAKYVLPDLVTKHDLEIAVERLEHRLTMRMIAIVATLDGILFALLRLVPGPGPHG
jgi:hypothetical protein